MIQGEGNRHTYVARASQLGITWCYNRTTGMSNDAERSKTTVEELAARFRGELIPLTSKFSYFSTLPIAEEDLRHYLGRSYRGDFARR